MQKIFTVKSYIGLHEPCILEFVFYSLYVRHVSTSALNKTIDFVAGMSSIFLKLSYG